MDPSVYQSGNFQAKTTRYMNSVFRYIFYTFYG
ncbi:MAG: hypothetical protein SOZ48_00350 [Eubacterium sp.]|nr:hypothetical protein [Eubacterium sp.]